MEINFENSPATLIVDSSSQFNIKATCMIFHCKKEKVDTYKYISPNFLIKDENK